jgi:hypothetical protein
MSPIFDEFPETSKTMYMVDEEFIGRDDDAVDRAVSLARRLFSSGYQWESSCRVDQVVDLNATEEWHLERAAMWRTLKEQGLRRMLFGIESGVTSILERFNKETTAEQNALAIRTLSALGIPTRFTYITFDHLMSLSELQQSHAFLARTDLLLAPQPSLTVEQVVQGVRDEDFVRQHSQDQPFHSAVSYMLVSMECLIGAAYTREVSAAGLAKEARPSMGRVDADFRDWRIGRASAHAQLWVDRNFALDYTLKSIEKVIDGVPRRSTHQVRVAIRESAFRVLTSMIEAIRAYRATLPDVGALDIDLVEVLNAERQRLEAQLRPLISTALVDLPTTLAESLRREGARWTASREWALINASDPCGT